MKRKWRNRRRYSGIRGDSPDGEVPLTAVHTGTMCLCLLNKWHAQMQMLDCSIIDTAIIYIWATF